MNSSSSGPTWKWVAATLLAIALSFGGYWWNGIDRRSMANEGRIERIESTAAQLAVDIAQEKVRGTVEYREILRRLDRIESSIERLQSTRFPSSPANRGSRGFSENP